jgi:ribulose-phosphate 3-epimerase
MVLIMTVEPGFGGQKLIPYTIDKVRELKQYMDTNGHTVDIQVDGGITTENLPELLKAGANVIVAGSAIFKAEDPAAAVAQMKNA